MMTNACYVIYMSEKIHLKNRYTIRERLKDLFVGKLTMDTCVQNQAHAYQYFGISLGNGKIVIIDLAISKCNFFIIEEYILSTTASIDLINSSNFIGARSLKKKFYKTIQKDQAHDHFEEYLQDKRNHIKPAFHFTEEEVEKER